MPRRRRVDPRPGAALLLVLAVLPACGAGGPGAPTGDADLPRMAPEDRTVEHLDIAGPMPVADADARVTSFAEDVRAREERGGAVPALTVDVASVDARDDEASAVVAVRGLDDEVVAGYDLTVTLRRDVTGWLVTSVVQETLCARAIAAGECR